MSKVKVADDGGEVTDECESEDSDFFEEKLKNAAIGTNLAKKSGPGRSWSAKNNNYCGVLNCPSTTASCKDLWFFKLPLHSHEPERREQWLEKIKRPDVQPYHRILVCERHFDSKDIRGSKNGTITSKSKLYLKKGVIPTLHLPTTYKKTKKNLHKTKPKHVYKRIDPTVNKTIGYEEPSTSRIVHDYALRKANIQKEDPVMTLTENPSTSSMYVAKHRVCPSLQIEDEPSSAKSEIITNIKLKDIEVQLLSTLCNELASKSLETFIRLKHKFINEPYANGKYSDEVKSLILEMYYAYPQCYEVLQDMLSLPPQSALKSFIPSSVEGLNRNGMQCLVAKLNLKSPPQEYGILCLDIVKITPHVYYDHEEDMINGINKQAEPYRFAIIAMAQRISADWHQIVSVYFFNNITTFNEYRSWADKVILSLYKIGISIIAIVTSTDDFFVQAYSIREASIQYLSSTRFYFLQNGERVWHIFDPLHLILSLYEELQDSWFIFHDNCKADWKHVKDFFLLDKEREIRLSYKSCTIPSECSQQDKLELAAEILLDGTTASGILAFADMGILSKEARQTARFLMIIREAFKFIYAKPSQSHTESDKKLKKNREQAKKLNKSVIDKKLNFFKNLKSYPKSDRSDNEKVIKCLVSSFRSILTIIEEMNILEVTSASEASEIIGKFNLNPLVEFIDRMKLKNSKPFTSEQLIEIIKESYIQNKGQTKINAFVEYADRLIELKQLNKKETNISLVMKDHSKYIKEYNAFSYDDANSLMYVATYLLEKMYQQFKNDVSTRMKLMNSSVHYEIRGSGFSGTVIIPDDEFLQLVINMDTVFFNYWKTAMLTGKWFATLKEKISKTHADVRYSAEATSLDFIRDLFIHLRIYHVIGYNESMYKKADNELHEFVVKRLEGYKLDYKKVQLECLECFRNPTPT